MADTGGPCTVNDCTNRNGEPGCMFGSNGVFDPGYMACVVGGPWLLACTATHTRRLQVHQGSAGQQVPAVSSASNSNSPPLRGTSFAPVFRQRSTGCVHGP